MSNQEFENLTDEILAEIIQEENQKEIEKQEIIKNGCPHVNKTERVGTISKVHFLECDICKKQFDMMGNPIK
ncbi:hypothetical protein [Anaerovorax sp. IOR16]|uniref:hypothetical protein n=1 Tax=Anaerovorax sp. IOR16 TaxID=2773458 RepID=UPI0019CFCCD0|nr:hypothetical protein [Anaerovorax sp. IOR16]